MTTIEDKIKLFSKIVYDKIQEEKQKELDIFDKEREQTLKDEREKIELRNKLILEETQKKALLKSNELIAKEKVENQQKILKLKQKFIDDSMAELEKKITEYTDNPSYKDVLITLIDNTLNNLENGKYYLFLTDKDINNYKNDINRKLEKFKYTEICLKKAEDDIIGGVLLISEDGKFRIDNTLKSKIEDSREYMGVIIMQKVG